MWTLYHHWLDPASRAVRLALAEKALTVELVVESPWERRPDFLALNPAGDLPVLVTDDLTAAGGYAALEFVEEARHEPPLIGREAPARAEARRLAAWFDGKFRAEVTDNLLGQKAITRLSGIGTPDSRRIRAGYANLAQHLDYVGWLIDRRNWLAGDHLSIADLAAAAHLSALDYIGEVSWDDHPGARAWYARIKSRPGFRDLLADSIPGLRPARHYAELDF